MQHKTFNRRSQSVTIAQWENEWISLYFMWLGFNSQPWGVFPGWPHSANPSWASEVKNGSISPQCHHTTGGQRGGRPKFNNKNAWTVAEEKPGRGQLRRRLESAYQNRIVFHWRWRNANKFLESQNGNYIWPLTSFEPVWDLGAVIIAERETTRSHT